MKHPIIISNPWALGDTVCLSALVRDIRRAYGSKHRIVTTDHYESFWRNNPYCEYVKYPQVGQLVRMDYLPGIQLAGRGTKIHFLSYFYRDFERCTGIKVQVTEPKGDIHLSPEEKANRKFPGRYWVINAGGKIDITAKIWHTERYQRVVDVLRTHGIECVQAGAINKNHYHPRLQNCHHWLKTDPSIRDLFSLIYHSEGVICGVTGMMHIAAVFDKPCVVVAGGREEPWWEAYSNAYFPTSFGDKCAPVKVEHKFLHTLGLLDCGVGNLTKGCWKNRTVPVEPADHYETKKKRNLCALPLTHGPQPVPACMDMIEADHVIEAVLNYYETGMIPPIEPKKRVVNVDMAGPEKDKTVHAVVLESGECVPISVLENIADSSQVSKVKLESTPGPPNPLFALWKKAAALGPPAKLKREWAEALPQPMLDKEDEDFQALDSPFVGGKVTVFVLCYGEFLDLAKRCIGGILSTVPRHRLDLRVALNQPSAKVEDYIKGLDRVTKVYVDHGERKKYPAMREMFHDPDCPITTKYVVWFDDDSHPVDDKWLPMLAREIHANHPHGCRLFGPKYWHTIVSNGIEWFKTASWWKNQWLFAGNATRRSPNGNEIVFASGGFWALATEVIQSANIPDVRLVHNGGDITIGAQVTQAGFKLHPFSDKDKNGRKWPIAWSDHKPRGSSHVGPGKAFPWLKPVRYN